MRRQLGVATGVLGMRRAEKHNRCLFPSPLFFKKKNVLMRHELRVTQKLFGLQCQLVLDVLICSAHSNTGRFRENFIYHVIFYFLICEELEIFVHRYCDLGNMVAISSLPLDKLNKCVCVFVCMYSNHARFCCVNFFFSLKAHSFPFVSPHGCSSL